MRVVPFHIPKSSESSVIFQKDIQPRLYDNLHNHDETQLTLIINKGGTVFIGGYMEEDHDGDVYIIKGGIPHVFRSEDQSIEDARAISIFFDHTQIAALSGFKEFAPISQFLELCGNGARITGATQSKVAEFIKAMESDGDFQRMIKLMVMLRMIYETGDFESFDEKIPKRLQRFEGDRMNRVLDFTFEHYGENVTIDQVADIASMTNQAFCRYFKKHTRKSYINFLNEVRINVAKRIIRERNLSIAEVSVAVGFNNLSNFNRFFKKITGKTPSTYRKELAIHSG